MAYKSLSAAVDDLDRSGQLIRIKSEVDPNLVLAEIHRRVFDVGGPALLFERVKDSPFPVLTNLFGTFGRTEYLFRDTLENVRKAVAIGADPMPALKKPLSQVGMAGTVLNARPKQVSSGASQFRKTTISAIPQIVSWPKDGGAFVTMPQVLTMPPNDRNIMHSNIGMYRVQLSGNDYEMDKEVGMHYQLHRGIGVHHTEHNNLGLPFNASVFIGGPPAHSFSAIMPMPEGISELTIAGMLAGRRYRYAWDGPFVLSMDADFIITGTIPMDEKKPEGPFGDHLGYYSLEHPFPVMHVASVYHRKNAIWLATVVGRPPQEDSSFGYLIHELVGNVTAKAFPGLKEVHAVDAAGVHPLLLAIGSERYMPFRERKPEEILTIANHLLGMGQTSLAKYLWIAADGDDDSLNTHNIPHFFQHMLRRIDFSRDLHFQTATTIDTLDYSGSGWNSGSKVVIAACGPELRSLAKEVPASLQLPDEFGNAKLVMPGVVAVDGPSFVDYEKAVAECERLASALEQQDLDQLPLFVVCSDSAFCSETLNNFLWVTFTRSNPSHDIYGAGASVRFKHWGCKGPLIIDARTKPHHAPELETDPEATRRAQEIIAGEEALMKLDI